MPAMSFDIDVDRVRSEATRRGLFLNEMAAASQVSEAAVYSAMSKGRCGLKVARAIAKALGLEPAQIIKLTSSAVAS